MWPSLKSVTGEYLNLKYYMKKKGDITQCCKEEKNVHDQVSQRLL